MWEKKSKQHKSLLNVLGEYWYELIMLHGNGNVSVLVGYKLMKKKRYYIL